MTQAMDISKAATTQGDPACCSGGLTNKIKIVRSFSVRADGSGRTTILHRPASPSPSPSPAPSPSSCHSLTPGRFGSGHLSEPTFREFLDSLVQRTNERK